MAGTSFMDSIGGASGAVGLGLGILPSLIGIGTGIGQRRRARKINPQDPGFVANQGLLDNRDIVNREYSNYSLPGKSGILDMIRGSFANNMNAIQGAATSSEDILGGVTNLAAIEDQSLMDLGIQEAESKQGLLPMLINANAAAGNEAVRENALKESRYQEQMAKKASLETNGAINTYKNIDNLATLGGSLLNYRAEPWTPETNRRRRVTNG